jgi:hypothetical protein
MFAPQSTFERRDRLCDLNMLRRHGGCWFGPATVAADLLRLADLWRRDDLAHKRLLENLSKD